MKSDFGISSLSLVGYTVIWLVFPGRQRAPTPINREQADVPLGPTNGSWAPTGLAWRPTGNRWRANEPVCANGKLAGSHGRLEGTDGRVVRAYGLRVGTREPNVGLA